MPIRPENRARYPRDWKIISKRIRIRAGSRCEFCGIPDGDVQPGSGAIVVLTVAHMDHVPENCSDENLKALCQKCHNSYDAEHRSKNRATNAGKDREAQGQLKLI